MFLCAHSIRLHPASGITPLGFGRTITEADASDEVLAQEADPPHRGSTH